MRRSTRAAAQLASIAALVLAWEVASRAGWADPQFVPPPSAVARALGAVGPEALRLTAETLGKTLAAYVLAVIAGVGLGLLIGSVRHLYDVLNPFVVALYAIPKILVLPWVILAFGLGAAPAIAYGVMQGVFPVCLLVMGAVRDLDPRLLVVARALGARPSQCYWKVILPAVVPAVLAGMRLAMVFCLLGVLVVEMFGGIRGLGFLLTNLANAFRPAELFAATAIVSTVSIAVVLALEVLNRRLGHWR